MRPLIGLLALILGWTTISFTHANIIFPKIQPTCNYYIKTDYTGCLRGQVCLPNDTCVADHSPPAAYSTTLDTTPGSDYVPLIDRDTTPRSDGRCGSVFDGATCDANGEYGGCCSQYGYCGKTPGHCDVSQGCQSGCSDGSGNNDAASSSSASDAASSSLAGSSSSSVDPTTSQLSSSQAASSSSISAASNPGASNTEPVIAPASSTNSAASSSATGAVATDGTCGASNGNTVCGNWPQGSCCSMYGFCGNSSAHCGEGCQSGPCLNAPVVPAPSASPASAAPEPGSFKVVGQSGVPAMHAALLPNGRVVFLDKAENYTQLNLSTGYYAYSSEYNPATNEVVPLAYKTNAFCSGGSFLPNGTLLNVGGNAPLTWLDPTVGDGFQGIRYLTRGLGDQSLDGEAWVEPGNQLNTARWYPTVQTLPDGRLFVASGSLNGLDPTVLSNNNPTYEVLSAEGVTEGQSITLPLLVKAQPYYMVSPHPLLTVLDSATNHYVCAQYPFIHLLQDGTLFLFVSKSAETFDLATNSTVKTYPDLPGDYRTYPNTGGSVMLPLSSANDWTNDIVVCGGGAYQDITSPTDPSCGRISPLAENAEWEMDSMPEGRGMVEGTLLPDGTVLWVNGANFGSEGFNLASDPTFEALIYDPDQPLGKRWMTGANSTIPRLYHSVALLLLDGTLMVAGSNPDQMPVVSPAKDPQGFNTEFRVEIYTPPYLSGDNANKRPTNITLSTTALSANAGTFTISFNAATSNAPTTDNVKVALYHGGFVTHAVHMSHRILFLDTADLTQQGDGSWSLTVTGPPNSNVAPPGPYVVYLVVGGVPGMGSFLMVE
jgi:hypothetical protein